jgi:hypothetical protein
MKNVKAIIETLGGLNSLERNPISLRVPSFMPLSVEIIGRGPRGGVLLSVMHWFEQNGDLMRDPDVEIEIMPDSGEWLPVSYRQDSLGIFQEAVAVVDGEVRVNAKLVRDLRSFLVSWDRNVGDQGFVEAAKALAVKRRNGTG